MSIVWVKLESQQIHYLNRVLEGYEYLGALTTLDPKLGIAQIRATEDTIDDVLLVLENLPFQVPYSFDASSLFEEENL